MTGSCPAVSDSLFPHPLKAATRSTQFHSFFSVSSPLLSATPRFIRGADVGEVTRKPYSTYRIFTESACS